MRRTGLLRWWPYLGLLLMDYDDVRRLVMSLGVPEGASDTVTTVLLLIVLMGAVGTAVVAILRGGATTVRGIRDFRLGIPFRVVKTSTLGELRAKAHQAELGEVSPAPLHGASRRSPEPLVVPTDATPVKVEHRRVEWPVSKSADGDFEIGFPRCSQHHVPLLAAPFALHARKATPNYEVGQLNVMRCPTDDAVFTLDAIAGKVSLYYMTREIRDRLRAVEDKG